MLRAIAVACAVFAGCSGAKGLRAPSHDGATDSAWPEGGGADGPPADVAVPTDAPDSGVDRGDAPSGVDSGDPDHPRAVNAACEAPMALGLTTPSVHGQLDFGGPQVAACVGATGRALFYAVDVPAGHRLTAVAIANTGSGYWQPALTAFSGCGGTACLARSDAAAGGGFRLDWANNAGTDARVIVAVAANVPVAGAEFDLAVTFVDLNASCERPIPVQDGTTLTNLDLAGIAPSKNLTCSLAHEAALYYVATVLPQQELTVTASRNGGPVPVNIGLRGSCGGACSPSSNASTLNLTTRPETVLIEVTSADRRPGLFDLQVSLPPAPAYITVAATSPLVTTEAGGQATFQVVLESQPAASVTINLTSDRPSEGTVSPAKLVFDATNWSTPQTATVTGVDDQAGDGAQRYSVVTAPAVSADPLYSGLDPEDLSLTNLDGEPSLIVDGVDDVVTSEDGTPATFTIQLRAAPTSNVDVPLASSDTGEGAVSPASLRFTPANWNVPQAVTVIGANDAIVDGPQEYEITVGPVVSDDAHYGGQTPSAVVAHNRDDDFLAGTTTVDLGSDRCGIAGGPNSYPAAIDALGRIYAVLYCDGQLFLLRSDDGGRTVSGPTPILGLRHADGGFAIAAARDGIVYVGFGQLGRGFEVARSTDAGKSWSARQLLPEVPDLLRINAARGTVVIAGNHATGPGTFDGTVVLRSLDAGWSYQPPQVLHAKGQMMALGVQPDGKSVFLINDLQTLFGSTDAGQTFRTIGSIDDEDDLHHCCFVFGSVSAFSIASGVVSVTSLADATKLGTFPGPTGTPFAAHIDNLDVMTIVSEETIGAGLTATRFGSNHALASAKLDGPAPYFAGALPLSRHATAIVGIEGSHLTFTTVLW